MPCDRHTHVWPTQGTHNLVIATCETRCGWCNKYSTNLTSNLRAHARKHLQNSEDKALQHIRIQPQRAGRKRVKMDFGHASQDLSSTTSSAVQSTGSPSMSLRESPPSVQGQISSTTSTLPSFDYGRLTSFALQHEKVVPDNNSRITGMIKKSDYIAQLKKIWGAMEVVNDMRGPLREMERAACLFAQRNFVGNRTLQQHASEALSQLDRESEYEEFQLMWHNELLERLESGAAKFIDMDVQNAIISTVDHVRRESYVGDFLRLQLA